MSDGDWQDANNRYLAASLQWLRLKLRRLAPEAPVEEAAPASRPEPPGPPTEKTKWFRGWVGSDRSGGHGGRLLPRGRPRGLDEQIEDAAAEREAAASSDPPPALLLLAERFGLSVFERDTLLLCAAMELDPGLMWLCAQAQGNSARPWPTFGLALAAFDEPSWDAVSQHRPLRYARLIEVNQPGGTPLTASALRADERIVNFIKGLNTLDDWLATLVTPTRGDPVEDLSPSQHAVADVVLQRLHESAGEPVLPVVQLLGADAESKLAVASRVSLALARQLYRVGVEALPTQPGEIETLARLWQRETLLLPVALYLALEEVEGAPPDSLSSLRRFVGRGLGLVFLGLPETGLQLAHPTITATVSKPTPAEQREAWDGLEASAAARLAGQFDLNLGAIRQVVARVAAAAPDGGAVGDRAWDACRELTRPRLDALAQRLEPKATWDDLVLPDEQMAVMRQIAGQVRARHRVYTEWGFSRKMNRGFGISALFTGESGTGKTMAAEVLAADLRLNLYRIDLSAVVSKYIGETEKNLRRLFAAAEEGGAILFFDEADALFGKRSEVKDSHDRYANIEINYLLQRMELFGGLAILATNMKSALDPAFMRRLRFVVDIPFPGAKERARIWERALPAATPRAELDYERLARFNISGGNIHSIALNAAFAAAADGQTVTMPIVLAAARAELRKLEKSVHEAEAR